MSTTTSQYRLTTSGQPEKKKPVIIPFIIIGLAFVILAIVFFSGGDTATGMGRFGIAALITGGVFGLGFLLSLILRRSLLGFNAVGFLGVGLLFAALGFGGLMAENPLHTAQGDSYLKEGKYQEAVAEYRKGDSTTIKTKVPELYLTLGDQQAKTKNYTAAIDSYRQVSSDELMPNQFSATAKKQLGMVYFNWGLQLANQGGKDEEVLAKYDTAIKELSDPDTISKTKTLAREVILRLGDVQLQKGDFQGALSTYEKITTLYGGTEAEAKPYISKTYLTWGKKLLADGDFDGALAKLETNLKVNANGADINVYGATIVDSYSAIGKKLLADKKYDEVVAKITPLLANYQRFDGQNQLQNLLSSALTTQGGDYEGVKEVDKAIASYEKALTHAGSNPPVKADLNTRLVRVYIGQGDNFNDAKDYPKAIASFEKATSYAGSDANAKGQINTRLFNVYVAQGEQFAAANDNPKIIENYENALKYVAANTDPYNNVLTRLGNLYLAQGESFFTQGQFEKTINLYRAALPRYAKTPYEGQMRVGIAKSYISWADQAEKANQYQTALDRYRVVLSNYGEFPTLTGPASEAQPRIVFNWASKLAAEKDYNTSISLYQTLIDKYGGSVYAQTARNLLNAPQRVIVTVTRKGKTLANTKIKLVENVTFPAAGGFETSGRELNFTTDGSGKFMVELAPSKKWSLLFWDDGDFVAVSTKSGDKRVASILIWSLPLRAITDVEELGV